MSKILIQTYIRDQYLVSTLHRRSSARGDDSWYYETMVFGPLPEGKKHRDIIEQDESWFEEGAFATHQRLVTKYIGEQP